MPSEDLNLRALAVRFNLNVDELISREQPKASIEKGETKIEWYRSLLQSVQSRIDADTSKGKLHIIGCDGGLIKPSMIRAAIQQYNADCVFIDAAQDISDDAESKERTPSLYKAMAQLNQLARTCGVAIFITVQLDSEVEKKGLVQGNLNRIQWAKAFAQKAHVVVSMLGSRESDFRDMTIDKSRDGKAGRKFWLTFKFPEVCITSSTKAPGNIEELEKVDPVENVSELTKILDSEDFEEEDWSGKVIPPPPTRMPSFLIPRINPRKAPKPKVEQEPEDEEPEVEEPAATPAQPVEQKESPYAQRRAMKKLQSFKKRK
jgi:hypothetical protein